MAMTRVLPGNGEDGRGDLVDGGELTGGGELAGSVVAGRRGEARGAFRRRDRDRRDLAGAQPGLEGSAGADPVPLFGDGQDFFREGFSCEGFHVCDFCDLLCL